MVARSMCSRRRVLLVLPLVASAASSGAGSAPARCADMPTYPGGCATPPTTGACWSQRPGMQWDCRSDDRVYADADCNSTLLPAGDGHYDGFCTFAAAAESPAKPLQPLVAATTLRAKSPKRGVARAHVTPQQLAGLAGMVSWGYDWYFSDGGLGGHWSAARVGFVPMIHNVHHLGMAEWRGVSPGSREALLGFNEPDNAGQAALSPHQAAAHWHRVQRLAGAHRVNTLVSPAMTGNKYAGPAWMQTFLGACGGCRVDAIAIHSYYCTLKDVQDLVDTYRKFGRPIWITEMCCADPVHMNSISMDGEAAFMREVVTWLEQEPAVEKYAWFSYFRNEWQYPITNPNPDAGLVHWDGRVSRLGGVYRDLPR